MTLADIFHTLLYYGVATRIHEIKHDFTIDQVYLMYEKCIKRDLNDKRHNALTLANAMVYTSPYKDKNSMQKSNMNWNKFLDSMDYKKIIGVPDDEKKRGTDLAKDLSSMFGLPIKKRKGREK